jgi:hypothetical protein
MSMPSPKSGGTAKAHEQVPMTSGVPSMSRNVRKGGSTCTDQENHPGKGTGGTGTWGPAHGRKAK